MLRSSGSTLSPSVSRGALWVGHACGSPGFDDTDVGYQRVVAKLVANGYAVLVGYMPHANPEDCSFGHREMFDLSTVGSPIKWFVEPDIAGINYLLNDQTVIRFTDVVAIGLSGGGWTATMLAALDSRVRLSIPIAGTVPLYMSGHTPDAEQSGVDPENPARVLDTFYRSYGYLDIYVLGAYGSGRSQIQVLNRRDGCCYGEAQHSDSIVHLPFEKAVRDYESRIKTRLPRLGSGSFRTIIDEASTTHMISDYTIDSVILPALRGSSLPITIRSAFSGPGFAGGPNFCLDVPDYGRPAQAGDQLQLYDCQGADNQLFNLQSDGTVLHPGSGMCLDIPDYGRAPRNGDPIQLYACNAGVNQQFSIDFNGVFGNAWSGRCLDVPDFGRAIQNGDPLQIYGCHRGVNQQFSISR